MDILQPFNLNIHGRYRIFNSLQRFNLNSHGGGHWVLCNVLILTLMIVDIGLFALSKSHPMGVDIKYLARMKTQHSC